MSNEKSKQKVHAAVSGILIKNVPLNAANKEVNELSTVHNLETLRSNSVYGRSPSVSPIPTYSASPVVAGTLGLGPNTVKALTAGGSSVNKIAAEPSVGMGLGFSTEEYQDNNGDLLSAIERELVQQQQQQGKRKSRRARKSNRQRKTRRRRH